MEDKKQEIPRCDISYLTREDYKQMYEEVLADYQFMHGQYVALQKAYTELVNQCVLLIGQVVDKLWLTK